VIQTQVDELLPLKNKLDELQKKVKEVIMIALIGLAGVQLLHEDTKGNERRPEQ
jgi:hypothetical protein